MHILWNAPLHSPRVGRRSWVSVPSDQPGRDEDFPRLHMKSNKKAAELYKTCSIQSIGPSHWFFCFSHLNSRSLSSFPPEWFSAAAQRRNQRADRGHLLPSAPAPSAQSPLREGGTCALSRGGRISLHSSVRCGKQLSCCFWKTHRQQLFL